MGPLAITLLQNLVPLIALGKDVTGLVTEANARIKAGQDQGREPTDEDWAWLNAQIKALQDQLHAPGT